MKVVLINTQTPGGAYVACQRLGHALQKQGIEASLIEIKATKWNFLWERFCIWIANRFSRKNLFAVSIANTGTDISKLRVVREADIIHLHWINQGGLSIQNIEQLQALGKPIVWTMHDMWPFTGICHHAYDCNQYSVMCRDCPFLQNPTEKDLSNYVFGLKKKKYSNIYFVAVSTWLQSKAKQSSLVHDVSIIPNTLDTSIFTIQRKDKARKYYSLPLNKKIILMGAGRLNDPIKGFCYLRKALSYVDSQQNICLCVFGNIKRDPNFLKDLPVEVIWLHELLTLPELSVLYAAADVTIVPSLYETFGQTLSESLACGTPVVSFNNSGQTDIIKHKENGYLAKWKDSHDLAAGINYVLNQTFDREQLRQYAVTQFSENKVASQYIQLYQSLLNK